MFRFDAAKDRWTECARMKFSRYRCGTALLNGEIYILGKSIRKLWCCVQVFCILVLCVGVFRGYRVWWRGRWTISPLSKLCRDIQHWCRHLEARTNTPYRPALASNKCVQYRSNWEKDLPLWIFQGCRSVSMISLYGSGVYLNSYYGPTTLTSSFLTKQEAHFYCHRENHSDW